MVRNLLLTEFQSAPGIHLNRNELDTLLQSSASLTIVPSPATVDIYTITPSSKIGAIKLNNLSVVIQPKVAISRVLFLLSYLFNPRGWQSTPFEFDNEVGLMDAITYGFVFVARQALSRGVLQGYRVRDDTLHTVRGRIRVGDQLRLRYSMPLPIEVQFDDYTEDILENQLLKASLAVLRYLPLHDPFLRRAVALLHESLSSVSTVWFEPRMIPEVPYTRTNAHYRPAVEFARLILQGHSFDLRHGSVAAVSMLFDMNSVFEEFVATALTIALGPLGGSLRRGAKATSLHLDENQSVSLKPDISLWEGFNCQFIADVKYKKLRDGAGPNGDLYQLLAYLIATQLETGYLIYAAGETQPGDITVRHAGIRLRVKSIDISLPPREILRQFESLGSEIVNSIENDHG